MKPGPSVMPRWKPPKKRKLRGRARPEEPLGWCEFPACRSVAQERHHKLRRSQGGTDDRENLADLCSHHHAFVHANPALGYELGLLIRGVK